MPDKKPVFVTRYLVIDTHLTERSERPRGANWAKDIAKHCNQLDADGYEVISILPLTSGSTRNMYGNTLGYSVTDGVIITAKLRK